MDKAIKKFFIPILAPSMRSPSGITGWFTRQLMKSANPVSTAVGIQRLNIQSEDVIVELGAGGGAGVKSIMEPLSDEKKARPSRIVLVEISEDYRSELGRIVNDELTPLPDSTKIEIHGDDCKNMSSFLQDNSVDKIFAMNVVYFLDPLPEYLNELLRVLKPGGVVVFGCKFKMVPQNNEVFVNVEQDPIVKMMEGVGFQVNTEPVEVSTDEPTQNYVEIKGTKKN